MRLIGLFPVKLRSAASLCGLFALLWFLSACAGNTAIKSAETPVAPDDDLKQINQLSVSEDEEGVYLSVGGSSDLLFSEIRKATPPEVTFYFPGTQLEDLQEAYDVSLDPVSKITTSEVLADGHTAKISILLSRDVVYNIDQRDQGLTIAFSKEAIVEEEALTQDDATGATDAAEAQADAAATPAAPTTIAGTRIESVNFEERQDGIDVSVVADGAIKEYSAFTVANPPRIVFDLFDIDSPYQGLQKIAVDSKWVTGIRHFGYPDKLRIVLDTDRRYMTAFASKPVQDGLLISVSDEAPILREDLIVPAAAEQADSTATAGAETENVATSHQAKSAWLNKIEFTGAEGGESLVSIGTTGVVRYDLQRAGERKLQLKLFDTRVPEYRKRPLITTRFESAVDRVTPVQTDAMGDDAMVVFELREPVPFEVEQKENFIHVRFAPSTIPPKPAETTAEPEWKKLMEGAPAETPEVVTVPDQTPAMADVASDGMAADGPSIKWGRAGEVLRDEGEVVKRVDETILTPKKTYTGEKIALNFYDTDIKNVFRILGEISGQNFAIDKDVTGKVTLNFEKPVPWDQVLDLVLKMNQLGLKEEQGIFRIATQATLAREEKLESEKLEAARKKDEEQELVTEFFLCSYINARDTACAHFARTCEEPNEVGWDSRFSPRGSISVDIERNMIIANDIPKAIERIREILRVLDQVTPQVLIEARIVEANTDFRRDVGFDWGTVSIGGFDIGDVFDVTGIDMTADNIPGNLLDSGSIGFGLSKISGTPFDIIDARLQLGEQEGKTRIISAPKILTLDGKLAVIKQGFEIAFLERDSAGGSSVKFKEVNLELRVRPKVTPDNRVMMSVEVQKDDVTDLAVENPPLSTNQANTELLLEDGETIVIGGIIKATVSESESGIPGLRKIPGMGMLFKSNTKQDQQSELLIFMTPKIVKLEQKEIQSTRF